MRSYLLDKSKHVQRRRVYPFYPTDRLRVARWYTDGDRLVLVCQTSHRRTFTFSGGNPEECRRDMVSLGRALESTIDNMGRFERELALEQGLKLLGHKPRRIKR